jgi:DNA replicative helicase MCM subunit Mcm2 (Cdc46/Mcm family)
MNRIELFVLMCIRYIDIDKVDSKEQVPPREEQFQIMTRLALAHAKLRLSFNVKIVDVKEAIRLFQ